jgi:hypothetical protein
MRKLIIFTGLLLTFWLGISKLELSAKTEKQSQENSSNSVLWRITKNGELEGYLIGSLHLMKSDAYPLAPAFNQAFTRANLVVFEVNLDQLRSQSQSLSRLGISQDGTTLQETLPTDTYNRLQTVSNRIGLPLARLQLMEPWLVSQVVTARLLQQSGYNPKLGIDMHFFEKAQKAGKSRVALETPREQLTFFDELSTEKQITLLQHSLARTERTIQQVDEIVAAWKQGDMETIEQIVVNPMQNKFPALYETLIVERNQEWIPEIRQILQDDEQRPLVVVGAAHLPGNQGLIQQLREKGYTLQQL